MAFADRLAPSLTTIALCWRIARSDGVVLGFTSHDAPLTVAGLRYEAAPGMTPSAMSTALGLDVATAQFAGALTADTITESDLAAGRFDAAGLKVFMIDWSMPDAGILPVGRGTLGAVERQIGAGGGTFAATVRGPTAALDAVAVETCSPSCRAELGDLRCRVDLAPLTVLSAATAAGVGDTVTVAIGGDTSVFVDGRLRCLGGLNAGLDRRIAAVSGELLVLFEPLPFAVAAGDRVELRQGCDKRVVTCGLRFDNVVNFRGEPHVPGTDILTRFPGV